MRGLKLIIVIGVLVTLSPSELRSQQSSQPRQVEPAQQRQEDQPSQKKIPASSKVYVAPMEGFESYLKAAITKKKVPVELVEQKDKADYEITGTSESKKAGTAKIIIMGSWHSREEASIKVTNIKTGEVVYAYSAHKDNSVHGKQSTAEACAKHLRDEAISPK